MSIYDTIRNAFWDEYIWLIPGTTWEDLKPTPDNGLPDFDDLLPWTTAITILALLTRYFIAEPFFLRPLGRYWGIKDKKLIRPEHVKELEYLFGTYKNCKEVPSNEIKIVSNDLGWTERRVERWLRQRRAVGQTTKMFRFCDCSLQLFYYVSYAIFGVIMVYNKPWFWNIDECWIGYPHHRVTNDMWWYYIIPLSYYTYMILTFILQPIRKDSAQLFIHHVVTIILIFFSYSVNMIRSGSLILFVHESADIPLIIAKICGYIGHVKYVDVWFILFFLLWIGTRLILFPFWIIKNTLIEAPQILNKEPFPIYYLFNGLLLILLFFHFIWTFMIAKVIIRRIRTKEVRDIRSGSECTNEDEIDENNCPNNNSLSNHCKKTK